MRMSLEETRRGVSRSLLSVALLALAGCVGSGQSLSTLGVTAADAEREISGPCGEHYRAEVGLQIDMIRQQLEQGRPRSALAHLEEGDFGYAETRLMRGDALRAVGRHDEADAVYDALAAGCLAADAYRGMARNAVARGDRGQALQLMRKARGARPTDPDIRNDLGYLLLLEGQRQAAREELLTALELGGAEQRAAGNLVMLLMQEGRTAEAQRVATRYGVDAELVARLRRLVSQDTPDDHG